MRGAASRARDGTDFLGGVIGGQVVRSSPSTQGRANQSPPPESGPWSIRGAIAGWLTAPRGSARRTPPRPGTSGPAVGHVARHRTRRGRPRFRPVPRGSGGVGDPWGGSGFQTLTIQSRSLDGGPEGAVQDSEPDGARRDGEARENQREWGVGWVGLPEARDLRAKGHPLPKRPPMTISTILTLALLTSPDVTFHAAPPGGSGDVVVVDEHGAGVVERPAALRNVTLLDLESSGRNRIEEFLAGRARRVPDVGPSAARLALPGGQGSLYRFRKLDPGMRGSALRVLPRRPGRLRRRPVGTLRLGPASGRRSVCDERGDPRGWTRGARGDDSGGRRRPVLLGPGAGRRDERNTRSCPARRRARVVCACSGLGVRLGCARRGAHRSGQHDGGALDLGVVTAWYGDAVASEDGSTVAFFAGSSSMDADVFALSATGPVSQLSNTARDCRRRWLR